MSDPNILSMWAIYCRPRDYPSGYIARRFDLLLGGVVPTQDTKVSNDLEALRLLLPPGLVRIMRDEADDPCIVETWV